MIERVIENWLDNASERSLQLPFRYILTAEKYSVLLQTRHWQMEFGKDIIAIDENDIPCGFQLKADQSSKISLDKWTRDIEYQIRSLINTRIVHPSIKAYPRHRSIFVTNRELDESVIRHIEDMNIEFTMTGHHEKALEVIDRGVLLEKAKRLGISLWPSELKENKQLLALFLESGKSQLPKEKLYELLMSLFLQTDQSSKKPSVSEFIRLVTSGALLCALATSSFSSENNYTAEIEAWVIYLALVLSLTDKYKINIKRVEPFIDLTIDIIYNSLELLCQELMEKKHLIEGDLLSDVWVKHLRVTKLVSLMSAYGLWRKTLSVPFDEKDLFLKEFCIKYKNEVSLWGEHAIPQLLSFFWYWRNIDSSTNPEHFLYSMIEAIITLADPRNDMGLFNPYFDEDDVTPHLLGIADEPLREQIHGLSYSIEGIMQIYVKMNWKQRIKLLWPAISRISFYSFYPNKIWHYYLWRCDKGTTIDRCPPLTKRWDDLVKEANDTNYSLLPLYLQSNPIYFLLFLIVYPHRLRADSIRYLDNYFRLGVKGVG